MRAPTMQPSDALALYRRERAKANKSPARRRYRRLLEQAARELVAAFAEIPRGRAGRKPRAQ